MTTPEQIQAWARESGFITGTVGPQNLPFVTQVAGSFTVELQRFADLARADLVEDVKVLEKELGNTVSMARADDLIAERDALRTEIERLKAACDKYSEDEILMPYQTEVEALRKDAERYRHISGHLPIGTYADYEVSSKETWDIAIDAAMEKTK